MLRASAVLGLVFGCFLALAETARNWGQWQWWPFWLVDFIAAGLLLASSVRVLRRRPGGGAWLCGAWGFATSMFYMSFWSHIEHLSEPAEGNFAQGPLTVTIGLLWGVTLLGFGSALLAAGRHGTAEPARGPE